MSQFFDEIKLEAKRKREEKDFLRINKDVCQELKRKGENERIYQLFGQAAYRKYANKRYQKKDFAKLKKEGKSEDIYLKYGEAKYNSIIFDAMYRDLKQEKGNAIAFLWKTKESIKKMGYRSMAILLSAFILGSSADILLLPAMEINQNKKIYAEQISKSNLRIEEYVKQFEGKDLTDLQIIMKVVNDMWENVEGYSESPQIDAKGFLELDVTRPNGYGVCRHFATYVAKTLQALGYKAMTLPVYMDINSYKYYVYPNIEDKTTSDDVGQNENNVISGDSSDNTGSNEDNQETDKLAKLLHDKKLAANHMVVLVYIEEDDIYLVIDPTNPGIGVLDKNEIDMFNVIAGKEVKLLPRPFSCIINSGIYGIPEVIRYYLGNITTKPKHDKHIDEKYSVKSQNTALREANEKLKKPKNPFEDNLKKGVDQSRINKTANEFNIGNQYTSRRSENSEEIDK